MALLMLYAVALGVVGAGLAGINITVILHRGITHGAIRLTRPVYEIGRWATWLTTFMRHWEWRLVHRKHHEYVDVWIDEVRHDPHSPIVIGQREGINGFRRVAWHMATIFHREAKCPDISDGTYEQPTDRPLDRLDRWVFDRPVLGAVCTGVIYVAAMTGLGPILIGERRTWVLESLCVVAGALALGIQIALVLRFGGAINSDCHKGKELTVGAGYACNVKKLSFLIFGEGEHLTHHLYPQLAHISKRWDLGWRVIQVLRVLHLADVTIERSQLISN